MRTTPEHLIREYRRRGWWSDARIPDLFDAAVRAAPDQVAIIDPPNRPALLGDAARRLTFGDVADLVDGYCAAPARARARARRHPDHTAAERRRVSGALPRRHAPRRHREPGADAVPAARTRADRGLHRRPRGPDRTRTQGRRVRGDRGRAGRRPAAAGAVPRRVDGAGRGGVHARRRRRRRARAAARARRGARHRRRRRRDDLLDLRNRGHAEGRAALAQPLDRDQLRPLARRGHPARRAPAEPVPADQHGRRSAAAS